MSDEELKSDFYARETVLNEGAGYAVLHYIDAESFKSATTRRLWKEANQALIRLGEHLELTENEL